MPEFHEEMNFCRRCGTKLTALGGPAYRCENGHRLFVNTNPAATALVVRGDEVLVVERSVDPGKGMLDIPGGYCDYGERLQDTFARELREEVGLEPEDYSEPEYALSTIDAYEYDGEVRPIMGVVFKVHMRTDKQPKAGDDAANARFVPIRDVNLSQVYFPGIRECLLWLQSHS